MIRRLIVPSIALLSFCLGLVVSRPAEDPRILLENDSVRVREVIMQPGVENPEHTHVYPHVGVFVEGGTLEFHEAGEVETVSFEKGDAGWREAGVTHRIINRSSTPVHVVEVELK